MKHSDNALRSAIIEHLPRLRRFAYALTGSQADADDLLQTTVERLLVKGAPLDSGFIGWMYRVCKNLWIDEIRKNTRQVTPGSEEIEWRLGALEGEQLALDRLTLTEVNQAMQNLDESQRAVLALISLEGYSYKEVADILDIPIGTVMSRLARARKKLMEQLNFNERQAVQ